MRLYGVTMVKDELDILPFTIKHLLDEGLDGIIVADNLSTDGTTNYLKKLRRLNPERIYVVKDEDVGYYQAAKMTGLAHRAFERGADWVIPFDADEYWYESGPRRGRTLKDALERVGPTVPVLRCLLYNYFPTSADPIDEPNPFKRITYRDAEPAPLPKVIVRADAGVRLEQGNHGVVGVVPVPCSVRVAHFPWRSPRQFERKVRNGYAAYRATDLPDHVGAHWRQYGALLEANGPEALHEVYRTWFHDPPGKRLVHHPVSTSVLSTAPASGNS